MGAQGASRRGIYLHTCEQFYMRIEEGPGAQGVSRRVIHLHADPSNFDIELREVQGTQLGLRPRPRRSAGPAPLFDTCQNPGTPENPASYLETGMDLV